jgi:hypothetical protein
MGVHSQFFPFGHGPGKRGEGYSPTLNKEAVPLASANAYEKLGVEFGEWLMSKKDGIQSQ